MTRWEFLNNFCSFLDFSELKELKSTALEDGILPHFIHHVCRFYARVYTPKITTSAAKNIVHTRAAFENIRSYMLCEDVDKTWIASARVLNRFLFPSRTAIKCVDLLELEIYCYSGK